MHSSILSMPESFPCYLNPYFIIIKTLEQNCHLFRNTLSSLCSEMNLQIFLKMKCCSFCLVARKYFHVLLKCCFQFFQHETDDMWSLEIPWHFRSVLKENTPAKSQIKIFYKSCRVLFSSCPNLFTWVCMSTWLPLSSGGWVGPISHLHIIRIGQKVHTENAHLFKKNCVCVCAHMCMHVSSNETIFDKTFLGSKLDFLFSARDRKKSHLPEGCGTQLGSETHTLLLPDPTSKAGTCLDHWLP